MKYRIVRQYLQGIPMYNVMLGDKFIRGFAYRFEAVDWILEQEKKK